MISRPKIRPGHWILLFSLVGFGLRSQKLSFQPLWGDEGWSFYFAAQSLPQLLASTAIDIHPPLYYLLLKGWLLLAGSGPEAARFLSVIIGVLLIPVVGVLATRLFKGRVGAVAAAVTALTPLAVYYSQEVRMYGLVTLLGALSAYFFLKAERSPAGSKKWGVAYVLVTTAALYTMYYAVFIPLFQLLYRLLARLRRGEDWSGKSLFSTLSPFIYVGLLYLPWIIYAGPRLINYVPNKRTLDADLPLNFIRFLGDHWVAFSLGHLIPDLQRYVWAALPFVIVAVWGLVLLFYFFNRQRDSFFYLYPYLYLFVPLLMGYIVNRIFPFNPLYYERTLLLAAPAYWLVIAAGLVWLWDRQYLLVGTAVIPMLVITIVSLIGFYTIPRYSEEDYRPLLRDIAARATVQDALLASYQWQLGFYYAYLPAPRPRLVAVPGWGQAWAEAAGQSRLRKDLAGIFEKSPRLWFPAHQALGHLWEDQAERAIIDMGYPALLEWYSPQTKLTLAGSPHTSLRQGPGANFENLLRLKQTEVGDDRYEAGRGIVPVELLWQKQNNLGSAHRPSLRLADAQGRTWAIRDSFPRGGQAFFTDLAIGDTLSDRHGLLIPAGTPPGRYRLLLSVRQIDDAHPLDLLDAGNQPLGAELFLAEIEVIEPEPPVGPAALPVQFASGATFGQKVHLVGYSLGDGPFRAGESLSLNLFWQSLAPELEPLTVLIQFQDAAGQPVVQHEQAPIQPTTDWQRGTLLRDPHDLILPPTMAPGEYQVVISLLTSQQTGLKVAGHDQLWLTSIRTIDRPHIFEVPTPQIPLEVTFGERARLVGLDLPQRTISRGESLPLTLYWQALTTFDKSWTVFVHLINSQGQIVSQQDQIPGGGQFPTSSWLPKEYLSDTYHLFIPVDTPPGQDAYRLEIGLYDANDFSRLLVTDEGEVINDHILLESWPISIE